VSSGEGVEGIIPLLKLRGQEEWAMAVLIEFLLDFGWQVLGGMVNGAARRSWLILNKKK
jgi:hypothetical protein